MSDPAAVAEAPSVLVINGGSSSIKAALFTFGSEPRALARASVDRRSRGSALAGALDALGPAAGRHPLKAVGHRIVHGGPALHAPCLADEDAIRALTAATPLAPTHLPEELALLEEARRRFETVPHVLCFDTAFHADLPDVAQRLPIPARYHRDGVRRYGFHGVAYTYLMDALQQRLARPLAEDAIVLAHLGSGSSLAAVRGGRCRDTSMGLTPTGGVVMSTRSGDLDPGVAAYIARAGAFGPDALERELSQHAGLVGLSEGVSDMRELLAREASDERCRLAVDVYCYEIRKRIGAYAAALGGLDLLVFSGGIGEHAPAVRARICQELSFLGVAIDEAANAADAPVISPPSARVGVHVIAADEEVVIARAAYTLLS